MNSILHNCSHKDADVTHAFREEEVFVAIFNYIDHVFSLIKPKKVFFMAIDGVAPRAKMNQQRSRRFRSARDAEVARQKAIKEGIDLPDSEPFDSNAITPGTEFMAQLTKHLKYFINRKVSEDSNWQGITVILSGHEVPGEGEHKIMEYIRSERAKPDFSANIRHCLYGLDADLIMLGLVSHDPHFSLLREEVTFGRRSSKPVELTEQRFFLLHLSLVREYLEIDLCTEEDKMSFNFDFDRVLDDFILINFFIGNDFLPELPSLLINEGAMPVVMKTYKMYLAQADGYMTENGIINHERLAVWLDLLSKFEFEKFEEKAQDVEWFNEDLVSVSLNGAEEEAAKLKISEREKKLIRMLKPIVLELNHLADGEVSRPLNMTDDDKKFVQHIAQRTWTRLVRNPDDTYCLMFDADGVLESSSEDEEESVGKNTQPLKKREAAVQRFLRRYENAEILLKEDEERKQHLYSEKYDTWRNSYYKAKFDITIHNEDAIKEIAENYIEGLQWILLYYYQGVASWGWFYRYHYGPRITDVKKGLGKQFKFDQGHPFRPFEQLMSVLPDRSRKLVPAPYRPFMTEETSPIIQYYPREFALDMNGKKNDWEAVVKIPFVDEKKLLSTLATVEDKLTPEEKKRNGHGASVQFIFNPQIDTIYPTSLPGTLLDIENCHCIEKEFHIPRVTASDLRFGLLKGTKLGKESLAGFPSLKTLNFTTSIEFANAQVFMAPSRNESVVLTINSSFTNETASSISEKLIGETVYVGWPYLIEAKVCAVSDDHFIYQKLHGEVVTNTPHDGNSGIQNWERTRRRIESDYKKYAVRIGDVNLLVHAQLIKGLTRDKNGAFVKEFDDSKEIEFALQTVVEEVVEADERFKERPPLPLSEEFPKGSRALFLGRKGYGNPITISGYNGNKLDVELHSLKEGELTVGSRLAQKESYETKYMPSFIVAKQLGIDSFFLGKLTSKYFVTVNNQKTNIGLGLKIDAKQEMILQYSRKGLKGWEYTVRAMELIKGYLAAFRPVFAQLAKSKAFTPAFEDEFPNMPAEERKSTVDAMKHWLSDYKSKHPDFVLVPCDTQSLSTPSIKQLESYIKSYASQEHVTETTIAKGVPRDSLLAPTYAYHDLRRQKFSLGDRVVYALSSGKAQLYSRGTVVGIHVVNYARVDLDVLFDVTFEAGNTLGGKCVDARGLTLDSGSFINLTNKQLLPQRDQKFQSTSSPFSQRGTSTNYGPSKASSHLKPARTPNRPAWNAQTVVSTTTIGPRPTATAVGPKSNNASGSTQPTQPTQNNEQATQEILAMLKPKPRSEEEIRQSNEALLSNFGQGGKKATSGTEQLRRMIHTGPSYGPPSGGPVMIGPIVPSDGAMPAPHQNDLDQMSADLRAQLNIGQPQDATQGPPTRGRGRGRGNGRGRGSGRGGRGRGRGGQSHATQD